MSNLSDIGFPAKNEQDINNMISHVLEHTETINCPGGFYLKFSDASDAEIWLQGNSEQELIGFNPHFAGKSRRLVGLIEAIKRESSELDGAYHAWANPRIEDAENGSSQGGQVTVYLRENRVVGEGKTKQNSAGRIRSVYKVKNN